MKLVAFSVQNYRSITETEKLSVSDRTILIGPNNEGKSNILRALVTTLRILKRLGKASVGVPPTFLSRKIHEIYDWDMNFPISLQKTLITGKSVFTLELELSDSETVEFRNAVGSNLNGTLPIQIHIGKESHLFKVVKRGPGAAALSKKAQKIANFISHRIDCVYIQAVRTAKSAQNVVDVILEDELEKVEENEDFKKALAEISKKQQPVLDRISENIKITLKEFLPNIKDVKVEISEEDRYKALRRCKIIIDDGTPTPLQYKGDGVQSLAALSLIRQSSERQASGRHLILAIEEPKSHLHPRAVHQLKQVISDISKQNQVIITTHCPVFVDRVNIKANIIVSRNKASPAKNIKEIRSILGVRAADNLQHAELVLVVEGEDDRMAIKSLLSDASVMIKEAIAHGTLTIDPLYGAKNLSYKLSQLDDAMCNSHCLLDDDDSGRECFKKAELDGILTQATATFTVCNGMSESEIEDLYDSELYKNALLNDYGVSLDSQKFKNSKKWSVRMRDLFRQHGKQWDDKIEKKIKMTIAEIVAANPKIALNSHKRMAFDALTTALENKLANISTNKK